VPDTYYSVRTHHGNVSGNPWFRHQENQSGLSLIRRLYRVETLARKLTVEERYAMRQQQATPIIKEIREWLDASLPQIPPTSATGKALSYLHNEWQHLTAYLQDGRLV